ncbi:MAG: Crp/Fnr family transcriptional regulator [Betaproteobacteria bacterium]|nr:Crp/Fnr family transcriptional regulator [Betaproteobacteria bacterium]
MTSDLYQRRRPPTEDELANIPWLPLLLPKERERAINALRVGDAEKGDFVCRVGRPGVVAGLPLETFHWLIDNSLGFNRFVMNQLNERLGQFIAAREFDRLNNPDLRVARNLAALFNPVLFSGVGDLLRITQQELAYLVGLSRQRVNEALIHLQEEGLIRVEYGGLRILDLQGLRTRMIDRRNRDNQVTEKNL